MLPSLPSLSLFAGEPAAPVAAAAAAAAAATAAGEEQAESLELWSSPSLPLLLAPLPPGSTLVFGVVTGTPPISLEGKPQMNCDLATEEEESQL